MSKKVRHFNNRKFTPKKGRQDMTSSQSQGQKENFENVEPVLRDYETLHSDIKNSISKFLAAEQIDYPILGVIKSSDGYYNPVVHDLKTNLPLLIKKLQKRNARADVIDSIIESNKNNFSSIDVFELNKKIAQGSNYFVLKRTYALNTLQDALNSTISIPLVEVLKTLLITIKKVEQAHSQGFVHGHIHAGNICFKQSYAGHLLDAGLFLLNDSGVPNYYKDNKSIAPELKSNGKASYGTDVYGLGYTLKSIFECKSITFEKDQPSREEVLTVLGPIIDSSMCEDQEQRISLSLFSSIFNDLIPMFNLTELSESENKEEKTSEALDNPVIEDAGQVIDNISYTDNLPFKENDFEQEGSPLNNLEFTNESDDETFSFEDPVAEQKQIYVEKFKPVFKELSEYDQQQTQNKPNHLVRKIINATLLLFLLGAILILGSKFIGKLDNIKQELNYSESEDEYSGHILSLEDLSSAWASGVVSQMKLVADQAVYKNPGRLLAERVILSSVMGDQIKSELVDTSLLRVAFNSQWEEQLSEDDRRYALSLGLIQVLKNEIPRDLGKLEDRNPAVVIALMSSGSISVSKFLSQVPISHLEKLAPPYGPAFQLISTISEGKNCGDQDVVALARFGTRGIETPISVNTYLSEDFKRRLSALAILFTSQPDNARKVLDVVVSHPNLSLQTPEVIWAKRIGLVDWTDVDPADKLFLLAGVPLRGNTNLVAESVAKLFLNPSARVRGYAASLALDKISFKHKGAAEVLSIISKSPDILSQDQFVMLGQILEDPKKTAEAHKKIVQSFISSNPNLDIAKHLLVATSTEKESTILDSALSVYLSENNWMPNDQEIELLIKHPDKITRMMVYQILYKSNNIKKSKQLLENALKTEADQEYKEQLKAMIASKI